MSNEEIVREIAVKLAMLDPDGNLLEMDSLTVLDFVTELESRTSKTIPATHVRRTSFESIQSIVAMLEQLDAPS